MKNNNIIKTITSILISAACFISGATRAFAVDITGTMINGGTGAWNPSSPVTGSNFVIINADAGSTAGGGVSIGGNRTWDVSSGTISFNRTTGHAGGMRIQAFSTFIGTHMVFEGNFSGDGGGAIGMSDSTGAVRISYSTFTSNTATNEGGAIRASRTGVTISGSFNQFIENTAGTNGGAIFNYSDSATGPASLSLFGDEFSRNTATGNGGAIFTRSVMGAILDTITFTGNTASNGGAIYAATGGATITSSTFTGNIANTQGGAIFGSNSGHVDIENTTFLINTSTGEGGAIYVRSATLTVTSATFTGNAATGQGGAVFASSAPIQIQNSTFTANTSADRGGAIFIRNTTGTFNNVHFENNRATRGGAIFVGTTGDAIITTATFTGNTATHNDGGGAIYAGTGNATLTDVLFTSNTATGASGRGGAIFVGDALAVTLNTTTGKTLEYLDNAAPNGGFAYLTTAATLNINTATNSTLTIGSPTALNTNHDSLASADTTATITKLGIGTLILNANSNAFLGTLAATDGLTLLGSDNARLGGSVAVSGTATFGGLGAATGDVTLANNTNLLIGLDHGAGASAASAFSIDGALTFTGTARLLYDLISDGVNDHLTAGSIALGTGTSIIDLNTTNAGTYTLITLTAGTFDASATAAFITTKTGETLSGRISTIYSLENSDTELVLTLDKTNYLRTWAGADSAWNVTSENWTGTDNVDQLFLDGDKVVFNDVATIKTINLAGGMTVADMLVETATTYTFTGAAIETNASSAGTTDSTFGDPATGKLTKKGAGTLILENAAGGANNFTGGIALDSGTLQASAATLGSALITGSDNTTLVLNQTTAATLAATLAGNAAFFKTGDATLTLSAADQLLDTASVTIAAGTLDTAGRAQTLKNLSGSGTLATGAAASTLTLNSAVTSTFSGIITGAASIEKTGAATLVLAGDNTHAGTTTITGGTLQLGAGAVSGSVLGTILNNSALVADHGAANSTLAATLSGPGTFTKLGAGALSLTADSSGYTGATTVSAGTLLLNLASARLGGAITVGATGALGGIGGITGNVSVATGGAIIAGNAHNNIAILDTETFNIGGTLTLADKFILKYDLFPDNRSDLITTTNLTLPVSGTGTIDVSNVGTGTYTLLTLLGGATLGASATDAFRTVQNGNELSGRSSDSYSLSGDNTSLLLTIETANLHVAWAGTTSNLWASNIDNWISDDNQFVSADNVTFGATTSGTTIEIDSTGVTVSDMTVRSANNYTFTGGAINTTTAATGFTGTGKLVKDGAGTLTFDNTAATFIGGIDILQGTLVGNADTLNVGATGTITNAAALVFNQDEADATYTRPIIGAGSLAKTGTAALALNNAANTYAGGIDVQAGSLTLLNSGTSTRGALNIDSGATLRITTAASYAIDHSLTGSGLLSYTGGGATSALSFSPSALQSFSLFSGTLALAQTSFTLAAEAPAAALVAGTGAKVTVATGTHALASLVIDNATMIFSATAPADKTAQSHVTVTDLDISHAGSIQIGIPSDIPAVLPDSSRSILEQDDITDGIQLIAASGLVTGDGANLQVTDQTGTPVDVYLARIVAINKSPTDTTKIADAEYQYKLGTNDARDGLYFGYALSKLTIADGQVLELVSAPGANEAASTLSAIVEGAGGLLLNGAAGHNGTLTLGGNNTYAGPTQVTGGIIKAGSDNALGSTVSLDIATGATVDLNGKTQTIGALDNRGALALGTGSLTIRSGGSSAGTLTGAPGSHINFETGATAIAGKNPGLHASLQFGSGATITAADAQGLGDGAITFNPGSTLAITNGGTLANTVASSMTNAGTIVKSGAGTLTITKNNTAFSGRVEIEDGAVALIGNASLGSATFDLTRAAAARIIYDGVTTGNLGANIIGRGTLVLANGARMTVDRDLEAFKIELRNSTINIAHIPNDDENFNTFHVASLAGTGTIGMSVNFGRAKHDQLIIDSAAGAGPDDHFAIAVTAVSSRRASADTLIPLIVGAAPSMTFELVDGSVTPDKVHTFTLWQGGQNQNIADPGTWYLAASPQLTRVADAIVNTTSMMAADWNYELESLNKRMGDMRRGLFDEGAPSGGNLWLAGNGYRINASPLNAGGYDFEQTVFGATLGADKIFRVGKSAVILGLFAGMTTIDRDFVDYGDGKSDVANGGLYATWMHPGGFFADVTVKFNNYKNSFTTRMGDETIRGDYSARAHGASLEIGYYIGAGSGWWCEPSAQIAYSKLQGASYTTDSYLPVTVKSSLAWQYRAMVRWGKTFGTNLNAYLKAALVNSGGNDGEIVINEITPKRADFGGIRTEFGIGATYALTNRSQLWLDYEYAKAPNYTKPWSFSAAYRLLW